MIYKLLIDYYQDKEVDSFKLQLIDKCDEMFNQLLNKK